MSFAAAGTGLTVPAVFLINTLQLHEGKEQMAGQAKSLDSGQTGPRRLKPKAAARKREPRHRLPFGKRLGLDMKMNWFAYLVFIPVIIWYIVFAYLPMWGILIAFKNYRPLLGFWDSDWIGFTHFEEFFSGIYAWRLIRNTIMLNVWALLLGFPAPILLALLLNEVKARKFKRTVQTITYLPHFISLVVICGMIVIFTGPNGIITRFVAAFSGHDPNTSLLAVSRYFRPIYTISGIWQSVGWNSIIYLSAMSSISPELYESADLDGANRMQKMRFITIPSIAPTIVILLIFAVGGMMGSSFEKVILLYNNMTMDRADVIASYVYRVGLRDNNLSFSTAVGLFSSVINFALLWITNTIARRYSDYSIW